MKRKDLTPLVCALAQATEADILILNECEVPISTTLTALRSGVDRDFVVPESNSEDRFHCFSRNSDFDLIEVHKGFRASFRRLRLGRKLIYLGIVHGVDIRNYDSEARQSLVQKLSGDINTLKKIQDSNRIILIGDFNMNPFDRAMDLANGLNAMMTRACVSNGRRKFLDEWYDLYYNPMWGLFGDRDNSPSGTIYDTSSQGRYGWSMFDQVIISYSVVDEYQDVQIITHAGEFSLLNSKGHPDKTIGSDHLPIAVRLKGEKDE